jgi:hypothetical protein
MHENLARTSFENWILASERAKKLRQRGYDVSVPPPHIGRPQLLLISQRSRVSNPISGFTARPNMTAGI